MTFPTVSFKIPVGFSQHQAVMVKFNCHGGLLGGSFHLVSGLVHPSFLSGLTLLIPFITGVITHLLKWDEPPSNPSSVNSGLIPVSTKQWIHRLRCTEPRIWDLSVVDFVVVSSFANVAGLVHVYKKRWKIPTFHR